MSIFVETYFLIMIKFNEKNLKNVDKKTFFINKFT